MNYDDVVCSECELNCSSDCECWCHWIVEDEEDEEDDEEDGQWMVAIG